MPTEAQPTVHCNRTFIIQTAEHQIWLFKNSLRRRTASQDRGQRAAGDMGVVVRMYNWIFNRFNESLWFLNRDGRPFGRRAPTVQSQRPIARRIASRWGVQGRIYKFHFLIKTSDLRLDSKSIRLGSTNDLYIFHAIKSTYFSISNLHRYVCLTYYYLITWPITVNIIPNHNLLNIQAGVEMSLLSFITRKYLALSVVRSAIFNIISFILSDDIPWF